MKCIKCKFKDKNTGNCTYPFKVTAAGGTKFDKYGSIVGRTHWRKK
ncbi:MAG: peptide ABC transporter ATP-binding protein [Candidatus Thermoplasmatota archaeon]|nr:peptide ABC transporter ATP-binding protein [Candidatus Thermoplasmatota archaeon]